MSQGTPEALKTYQSTGQAANTRAPYRQFLSPKSLTGFLETWSHTKYRLLPMEISRVVAPILLHYDRLEDLVRALQVAACSAEPVQRIFMDEALEAIGKNVIPLCNDQSEVPMPVRRLFQTFNDVFDCEMRLNLLRPFDPKHISGKLRKQKTMTVHLRDIPKVFGSTLTYTCCGCLPNFFATCAHGSALLLMLCMASTATSIIMIRASHINHSGPTFTCAVWSCYLIILATAIPCILLFAAQYKSPQHLKEWNAMLFGTPM